MGCSSAVFDILECGRYHHIARIEIEKNGNHGCTVVITFLCARVNVILGLVRCSCFGVSNRKIQFMPNSYFVVEVGDLLMVQVQRECGMSDDHTDQHPG